MRNRERVCISQNDRQIVGLKGNEKRNREREYVYLKMTEIVGLKGNEKITGQFG